MVTLTDIEGLSEADVDKLRVRDVASSPAFTCRPDQSLGEAIKQFGAANIGRLPVVHRSDPDRLIGMLRRSDIIEAYAADLPKAEKKRRSASLSLDVEAPGVNALALTVSEHSPWPGRPVHDLGISKDALIVSIERGGKALLPKGDTVLEAGDKLTVVAESDVCLKTVSYTHLTLPTN